MSKQAILIAQNHCYLNTTQTLVAVTCLHSVFDKVGNLLCLLAGTKTKCMHFRRPQTISYGYSAKDCAPKIMTVVQLTVDLQEF